jgi:hypothetical protein
MTVPSPPSARGASRIVSLGRAIDQPPARARATSTEVSEPLYESGAKRTVMGIFMSRTARAMLPIAALVRSRAAAPASAARAIGRAAP